MIEYFKCIINSFLLLCIVNTVYPGCDIPLNTLSLKGKNVWYNSSEAIAGFQFTVNEASVLGGGGGAAGDAGFTVSTGGETVLGFSFAGATFGPGCGIMIELETHEIPATLSQVVISNSKGKSLNMPFQKFTGKGDLAHQQGDKEDSYYGGWPIKTPKDKEISDINCPQGLGCECSLNKDCENGNCAKHLKGYYCSLEKGDVFPAFVGVDQFGETISIEDFANEGKYILIEMGAEWCAPCRELADWFSYGIDDITKKKFWKNEYNEIYDLVHNGNIYFITVLYEDEFRDTATLYTLEEWFNNYPDENIPILADENKYLHTILKPTGIPAITLLNENLEIIELSHRGLNYSFDALLKLLNSENDIK